MKRDRQKDTGDILTVRPTPAKSRLARKRVEKSVDYGLTAVTLGEVLKDRLQEAVTATKGNRSEVVRKALERYLEQLPELEKQRKALREALHNRAFLIVVNRVLHSSRLALDLFDYDGVFPDEIYNRMIGSMMDFEEWLTAHIPEGAKPTLEAPDDVQKALSDLESAYRQLWLATGTGRWHRVVERWRGQFALEEKLSKRQGKQK